MVLICQRQYSNASNAELMAELEVMQGSVSSTQPCTNKHTYKVATIIVEVYPFCICFLCDEYEERQTDRNRDRVRNTRQTQTMRDIEKAGLSKLEQTQKV